MGARTGFGGTLRVNFVTVLISLLLYQGLHLPSGLIWTRVVPSASMRPTLLDGDYVLGFPKADAKAPASRGDVVVFSLPSDPATEYVKRVVGLPGDRVQMIDGVLFINGE